MAAPANLKTLKLDQFSPHLNSVFEMHIDGIRVPLRLAFAHSMGSAHPKVLKGVKGEKLQARPGGSFVLHFLGPVGLHTAGIHPVTHPKLGTMEIHLVSSGPTAGGYGYTAVFG
jgi:hypothetical protein